MKNIFVILAMVAALAMSTGCSPSRVSAGEEGVMIHKPYVFGRGGVASRPIQAGLEWTWWSTTVERYDIKPFKYGERFEDLTASDNVAIDFDAYLTLKPIAGKTPILHEQFGRHWYENNVKDVYRNVVRNEARARSSIELRTDEKVITAVRESIGEKMRVYLKDNGIPVVVVKSMIGKVVPPDEVLKEAAATAAQKQREQTQSAREKAELSRAAAETAMALADKAYSDEFMMTTEQFLRNKELAIMSKAVESGNVSLIMNASDASPIFKAM